MSDKLPPNKRDICTLESAAHRGCSESIHELFVRVSQYHRTMEQWGDDSRMFNKNSRELKARIKELEGAIKEHKNAHDWGSGIPTGSRIDENLWVVLKGGE